MTNGERAAVERDLRQMVSLPRPGGLTDAQLLEQFVARRDAAAFEVLVWRHGPKVLGVCRRVLRHEQDAEDAFQATFLILVRKAKSIGARQSVGGWLSRVAYRAALRAKVMGDKRAARQTQVSDVPAADRAADLVWRDLRPVLDEELDRLPAKYRVPFILCYVDGKTNEEAARELGCPKGTVLSRLAWARERLRARLTRRGVTLTAGMLASLAAGTAEAGISASLVDSTLKTALLVAAGKAVADVAAAPVAALTNGALQTMLWTKFKIVAACVLVAGTLGAGGVLARQTIGAAPVGEQPTREAAVPADPPPKPDKPAKPDDPRPEEKLYEVNLRDQPWDKVLEWYSDISGLPFVGTAKLTGKCNFISPRGKKYTVTQIADILNEALMTQNYILFRRDASFTLLPADEKIDPTFVPRVRLDDLDKRGKTELVSVVLPLTNLNAKEIGPDVKKMQGPFGSIVVMEKGNQLILQDTAGNLRQIIQTIKDIEAREEKKPQRK
jgi:RNA polymerase sigma factor (sigma-70 family)